MYRLVVIATVSFSPASELRVEQNYANAHEDALLDRAVSTELSIYVLSYYRA